jgi:tetratricopeptide (TPR) repeat protein
MGEREGNAETWADQVLLETESEIATLGTDAETSILESVAATMEGVEHAHAAASSPIELTASPPMLSDTRGDGLPLTPAEALRLHELAGDPSSLVERIEVAIRRNEPIDRSTWLEAGRFLSEMGLVKAARTCLVRATGERAQWDLEAAEVLERQGDHREAARAILATSEPTAPHVLARIGELFLRDGDDARAVDWFGRALVALAETSNGSRLGARAPSVATLAGHLLELASRANQSDRVEALLEDHRGIDAIDWHLAAARALRRKGESERARARVERALAADPSALEPALLLFDLGREAQSEPWIDRALSEIRRRSLELSESTRAFVAAALLVARGAANEAERLAYAVSRIDLFDVPKTRLPAGWADRWLVQLDLAGERADARFDPSRAVPFELEAGLLDVLEGGEAIFGVSGVRVMALRGDGPPLAVWDDPPRVAFLEQDLARWLPKTFRFELGRALAALVEPRLRSGLVESTLAGDGTILLLDRAGLILAQDPVPVLETIGPRTPRGRALTAFAVADEIYSLWGRLGLGCMR